jgi:hypothetical protein
MTIADLSTLPSLPIPHLSAIKPKAVTMKQFKHDSVLSKPHGHLLKTVHPLFTETNVKLNGDLISFDAIDKNDSTTTNSDQSSEELFSLSSSKPPTVSSISKDALFPVWERIVDAALDIFAPIKQTNSKILDAFYTEKGHKYLQSLISLQQIIKRICQSCRQCPKTDQSLVSKCEIIIAIFDNLVELIDTERLSLKEPLEMDQTGYLCNICGANLNVSFYCFNLFTYFLG